ncbi:MAG: hypothetical protein ACRC9Q_06415 [Bacteroidales bacterium]
MIANTKTLSLPFTLPQTYLRAALFVLLSVLVPQIMHQFSLAGSVFLPILFITFFAAFRFGWAVGLICGIVSPLVSNVLTGMPPGIILYVVLLQCVVISLLVGLFTKDRSYLSFIQILAIIVAYQFIALTMESWLLNGPAESFVALKTSLPGMGIQLIFFTMYSKYLRNSKL